MTTCKCDWQENENFLSLHFPSSKDSRVLKWNPVIFLSCFLILLFSHKRPPTPIAAHCEPFKQLSLIFILLFANLLCCCKKVWHYNREKSFDLSSYYHYHLRLSSRGKGCQTRISRWKAAIKRFNFDKSLSTSLKTFFKLN